MRIKNKKAVGFLTAISVVLLLGGGGVYRWWASGAVPPAPDHFFDHTQMTRSIERMRAGRLDQGPLIELVEQVSHHIREAESVSFSNPSEALAAVVRLEQDLTRMSVAHQRLLEDLAAADAADWLERFQAFEQTSMQAYREAREWCRVFTRDGLERLGFQALLDLVVIGKDRSASLPEFPPWRQHESLLRSQYAAFEQAYRLRNELDATVLERFLRTVAPPPIQWYYARLYEARLPPPDTLCADLLLAQAEHLRALMEEVAAADPLEALAAWHFVNQRRTNLVSFAELLRPLEQADSLAAWFTIWAERAPQRERLLRDTQATGPAPDPVLRARFTELTSFIRSTELAFTRATETASPEAWRAFTAYVQGALPQEEAHCLFEPFRRFKRAWNELQRAEERLFAVRVEDAPNSFSRAVADVRLAAETYSTALGVDLTESFLAARLDNWAAQRWPGWEQADDYAERLQALIALGLWPDPRLAGLAAYLALVAEAASSQDVREQMKQWSAHVRSSLNDYPLLQQRIEAALPLRRDQRILAEMQSFIESRRDDALREYLETLGAGETPDDLRALSEAALAMLKLPDRMDALNVDHLPLFAERNAGLLPAAPPTDSVLYPLYEQQVLPLLRLAEEIVRLPTQPPAELPVALEAAETTRDSLVTVYPQWNGFDEPLARAVLASARSMFTLKPDPLLEATRRVARLLAWESLSTPSRTSLLELQRLLAASTLFLGEDPCTPGFADWVEQAHRLQERFDLDDTEVGALVDVAAAAAGFCHDWQDAPNSFRTFREHYRQADSGIRAMLEQNHFEPTGIQARLLAAQEGLARLQPIIEADLEAAHREGSEPTDLLRVASAYRSFAADSDAMPRLATYARAQAANLEATAEPRAIGFTPAFPEEAGLRIDMRRMVNAPETFGYGERWPRRGESASLWIESGGKRATFLSGSWRERDQQLRLTPRNTAPASLSLVWGQPITIGVTVAHSTTGERALVPEEDQSRWNPLNYGLYRVEPRDYALATFTSLHALLRELHAPQDEADYAIQIDPLLQARGAPEDGPRWILLVQNQPPGRDLDWPEVFTPLTAEEAEVLGRELREAVENWMMNGENPLLDLLP